MKRGKLRSDEFSLPLLVSLDLWISSVKMVEVRGIKIATKNLELGIKTYIVINLQLRIHILNESLLSVATN